MKPRWDCAETILQRDGGRSDRGGCWGVLVTTRLTSAGRATRRNREGDDQSEGSPRDDRGDVLADRIVYDDRYW
jgi:hypothetical protein